MWIFVMPVSISTRVSATECLHPARMDLLTRVGLLQNESHCMILGAKCCIIVKARSSIGNWSSSACSIRIGKSIVSKNFSKSWKTAMTWSSVYPHTSALMLL